MGARPGYLFCGELPHYSAVKPSYHKCLLICFPSALSRMIQTEGEIKIDDWESGTKWLLRRQLVPSLGERNVRKKGERRVAGRNRHGHSPSLEQTGRMYERGKLITPSYNLAYCCSVENVLVNLNKSPLIKQWSSCIKKIQYTPGGLWQANFVALSLRIRAMQLSA